MGEDDLDNHDGFTPKQIACCYGLVSQLNLPTDRFAAKCYEIKVFLGNLVSPKLKGKTISLKKVTTSELLDNVSITIN